jgi:NitT/TauT family transport system substrate-binding protein
MTRTRSAAGAAAALLASIALAACGGGSDESSGDDGSESSSDGGLTTVRVGETNGIPSAFLEFALAQGFFEDQGIDLQLDTSAGGAAAIPGMLSGDLDITGGNSVSALLAAYQGLPITLIAPGTFGTDDPESDFSAVLVPEDSDIESAADLPGHSVSVNTLQNVGDITISEATRNAGGDPDGIDYTELGFPDMLPALDSGNIDAAWVIEPFATIGIQNGDRVVAYPYAESYPNLQIGVFQTTTEYAESNPEIIEAVRAALDATVEAVQADPEAFRDELAASAGIDPEVAAEMVLPVYGHEIDTESLEFYNERMLDEGFIDEAVDIDALVLP